MYRAQPCKGPSNELSQRAIIRQPDANDKNDAAVVSRYFADPSVLITNIGMATNLGLALLKLFGGWAFTSDTLLADGWHSMSDLLSDLLTLATVLCGVQHGKGASMSRVGILGYLGGFLHPVTLFFVGCTLALRSVAELRNSQGSSASPSAEALWVSLVTVVIKEWLYCATMKVAIEQGSQVLVSNATHHRVDSLSSMVTALAVLLSLLGRSTVWVDPLGGVLISSMVIASSGKTFIKAWRTFGVR